MMRPTASTGTFNCVSSTERQTSPAPETPGAPIDKIIIEATIGSKLVLIISIP